MKERKEFRLFVGKNIINVEKSTKRKPARVTFQVSDEFADKAIKHCLNMQPFSLKMPIFLGLTLLWDEEIEEKQHPL